MINGQAHGPAAGHGDVPAPHAQVRRRRHDHDRAVAGRRVPDRQGPDGRPRGVRPHRRGRAASSPRRPAARPTPTSSPSRRWWPTRPWTRRRASAAAPAWRRARTAPPTSSPRPRSPTSTCCPRASPSATAASRPWWTRWRTYFGSCTNHGECEAACPKMISIDFIALMNSDYLKAKFKNRRAPRAGRDHGCVVAVGGGHVAGHQVEVERERPGGVGHHERHGADPHAAVGGHVAPPPPAVVDRRPTTAAPSPRRPRWRHGGRTPRGRRAPASSPGASVGRRPVGHDDDRAARLRERVVGQLGWPVVAEHATR